MYDSDQKPFQVSSEHAVTNKKGRLFVMLPSDERLDQALMHCMQHRVVDLLAEKNMVLRFNNNLEERLAALSPHIVSDFIDNLLNECRAAAKEDGERKAKQRQALKKEEEERKKAKKVKNARAKAERAKEKAERAKAMAEEAEARVKDVENTEVDHG